MNRVEASLSIGSALRRSLLKEELIRGVEVGKVTLGGVDDNTRRSAQG